MDAREAVSTGAANQERRTAALSGPQEREAPRRRERRMASGERTNLAREARDCWEAPAKNVGEKMGRGGKKRFEAADLQFDADANLARRVVRWVSRAPRTKVAKDPWGSVTAADASRRRRLQNLPIFGGGTGERLLPGFPRRNSFRRWRKDRPAARAWRGDHFCGLRRGSDLVALGFVIALSLRWCRCGNLFSVARLCGLFPGGRLRRLAANLVAYLARERAGSKWIQTRTDTRPSTGRVAGWGPVESGACDSSSFMKPPWGTPEPRQPQFLG